MLCQERYPNWIAFVTTFRFSMVNQKISDHYNLVKDTGSWDKIVRKFVSFTFAVCDYQHIPTKVQQLCTSAQLLA